MKSEGFVRSDPPVTRGADATVFSWMPWWIVVWP
ncbi:uncharacterized protein SOCE26_092980 [Sorangium cellulosum]|uniref:Uncharacterized protein n=1 Tax=Sorangium cellulosum TaxID=56 RepID=A0A2L0F850_SORCE|nr:uncharacterized protein SOCE26_092980 [Sorangium cellulosum]